MTPVIEIDRGLSDSLSAYGMARSTTQGSPLTPDELLRTHAYWRACNYLALGMIYLQDNPLLRMPLNRNTLRTGFWATGVRVPGLAFVYIHLNRLIKKLDQNMIFMAGPGHGAPGVLAPCYLEALTLRFTRTRARTCRVCTILQAVLLSGRHRQPLHTRNAGLDP